MENLKRIERTDLQEPEPDDHEGSVQNELDEARREYVAPKMGKIGAEAATLGSTNVGYADASDGDPKKGYRRT